MGPVILKSIGGLVALAGSVAAGIGVSHAYSGSPTPDRFNLASYSENILDVRSDKRVLSFVESDVETDKNEWSSKLTQFKKELVGENEDDPGGFGIQKEGEDAENIKKFKSRCPQIKVSNPREFVKWCMVKIGKNFAPKAS